jgi:peptide/nickel transport system permease protein
MTVRGRAPWQVKAATVLIVAIVLLAILPLTPYHPLQIDLDARLLRPSWAHWMGTDDLGRDLLSRVVAGARISVIVLASVMTIAGFVGIAVGVTAGFFGGMVENLLMRLTELFLAFPSLILAAAISATFGGNIGTTMAALAAVYWPWYARIARSQVVTLRRQDFVVAAEALGASYPRLLIRTILPLVWPVVLVQMTLDSGTIMVATAGLSFLGLGAQPPTAEWGSMIFQSLDFQPSRWWLAAFPGAALALTSLSLNILGDYFRDRCDPGSAGGKAAD